MYKRIARYVHPDKNAHERATEAFQKLLSSWRHPLPSLPSPSHQTMTLANAIIMFTAVIERAKQTLVAITMITIKYAQYKQEQDRGEAIAQYETVACA
jgi:hypothetical protein